MGTRVKFMGPSAKSCNFEIFKLFNWITYILLSLSQSSVSTFCRYTCIYTLKHVYIHVYLDKVKTTNLGGTEYMILLYNSSSLIMVKHNES
jgi:hypothetical protein